MRAVSFVVCASAGVPMRFMQAHALHWPRVDVSAPFRISVTHSQHFACIDSCDVKEVARQVNPSCGIAAERPIAPPAAQTKVADRVNATRFDRSARSDAKRMRDTRPRFVGRRR
ncbi:hypothetical protein WJ06_16170 [Burkholderia cepacia]|nr:hypothetical protein WJ06_16170 [Burkholderia cepacia]